MRRHHQISSAPHSRRGFTLPEYVVTVALTMIVSAGMMAAYMFGGRMSVLAQTKLDTSDDVRYLVRDFVHDVRTASDFDVGTGTATTFTPVVDGQLKQGNAIQIYPTTGTNEYVRYYLDTNSQTFMTVASDTTGASELAAGITNKIPFTVEDPWGNVATNDQPAELVGLKLQFNPTAIRNTTNGASSFKQFYQINTRVNKRTTLGFQY